MNRRLPRYADAPGHGLRGSEHAPRVPLRHHARLRRRRRHPPRRPFWLSWPFWPFCPSLRRRLSPPPPRTPRWPARNHPPLRRAWTFCRPFCRPPPLPPCLPRAWTPFCPSRPYRLRRERLSAGPKRAWKCWRRAARKRAWIGSPSCLKSADGLEEARERLVWRQDLVREALGDTGRPEETSSFRRSHFAGAELTITRDQINKHLAHGVDVGLEAGTRSIRQRRGRIAVRLALAILNGGDLDAEPLKRRGDIDMQRDHADRAGPASARHRDVIRSARERIGRRIGVFVEDRPDRLPTAHRIDLIGEVETSSHLAAGRIDVHRDRAYFGIIERRSHLVADVGVDGLRIPSPPAALVHQYAAHWNDRDPVNKIVGAKPLAAQISCAAQIGGCGYLRNRHDDRGLEHLQQHRSVTRPKRERRIEEAPQASRIKLGSEMIHCASGCRALRCASTAPAHSGRGIPYLSNRESS